MLDRLLDGGHITVVEYLERLPDGLLPNRLGLIEAHSEGLRKSAREYASEMKNKDAEDIGEETNESVGEEND